MRIKKAWIDYAEKRGACKEAIRWLRERPRTLKQLAEHTTYGGTYAQGISWLNYALCNQPLLATGESHRSCMLPREARKPARAALKKAMEAYASWS